MEYLIRELFDPLVWQRTVGAYWLVFIEGMKNTLIISAQALALACILGIIAGVMRVSRSCLLNAIAKVYVEISRNTPLLL